MLERDPFHRRQLIGRQSPRAGGHSSRGAPRTPSAAPLLATAVLAGLAAILIFLTIEVTSGNLMSHRSSGAVLALVVVCFVGFSLSVLDGRRGLLDLLVWYFFLFCLSWPGYLHALAGNYPWGPLSDPTNLGFASFVVAAFLLSYYLGSLRSSKPKTIKALVPSNNLYICLIVCALFSSFIALYIGFGRLFLSRTDLEALYDDKSFAYPYLVGKALALVGFAFSATMTWGQTSRPRRPGPWLFFAVFSLLVVIWFNPLANPRFQTLAVICTFLAVVMRTIGSVGKSLFAGGLFVMTLFVLGPIKKLGMGQPVAILGYDEVRTYLMGVDFDTFQWVSESLVYVAQNGYLYGGNLLGAVLFFIPRPLWPGKPVNSAEIVSLATGYWYPNVSCPIPAELYLAGGLVGVVVGGYLIGRLVARLDVESRVTGRIGITTYQTVLASLAAGYAIILLRGSLGGVVPLLGFAFVFYWLISLVSARASRQRRPKQV